MAVKKKKPEDELAALCREMCYWFNHWHEMKFNGCSDPFWSDGMNMNLSRNHMIIAQCQIETICTAQNWPLPDEYYAPIPKEVSYDYFALPGSERAIRLKAERDARMGVKPQPKPQEQLSLF